MNKWMIIFVYCPVVRVYATESGGCGFEPDTIFILKEEYKIILSTHTWKCLLFKTEYMFYLNYFFIKQYALIREQKLMWNDL